MDERNHEFRSLRSSSMYSTGGRRQSFSYQYERIRTRMAKVELGVKEGKVAYEKRLFSTMTYSNYIILLGFSYYIYLLVKDIRDSIPGTCDQIYHFQFSQVQFFCQASILVAWGWFIREVKKAYKRTIFKRVTRVQTYLKYLFISYVVILGMRYKKVNLIVAQCETICFIIQYVLIYYLDNLLVIQKISHIFGELEKWKEAEFQVNESYFAELEANQIPKKVEEEVQHTSESSRSSNTSSEEEEEEKLC